MIDQISQLGAGGMQQDLVGMMKDAQAKALEEIKSNPEFANPAIDDPNRLGGSGRPGAFDNMLGNLVKEVDDKIKVSRGEANKVLLGESDNIHQSMIASQESGLAFTLLVEVRNKLVQSYQELMRMPV